MSEFDTKEEIVHPLGYTLRDAEKSLGGFYCLPAQLKPLLTAGSENHADETSSTYSGRGSGILSDFDPNYDSNSVLGM